MWTIVAVWCAGCGVDDIPARGFDSRQILSVRDPQLRPATFTRDESKVYLARYVEQPSIAGVRPPYDLSTLDLETAEQQPVAPAVFSFVRMDGGQEGGATLALLHYPSAADVPPDFSSLRGPKPGSLVLSFVSETSRPRLDVSDVADSWRRVMGTSAVDPIAVDRFDAAGTVHLWFGPPDNLRMVHGDIGSILGFDATGAFAGTLADGLTGKQAEIRHLRFDGGEAAVVVTSALGAHTAVPDETGEASAPNPDSGAPFAPQYGCAPPTSDQSAPRCFLAYTRAGTIGGSIGASADGPPSRLFVRTLDDPRERALPGFNPIRNDLYDTTTVVWTAQGSSGNRLYSWAIGAEHAVGCDVPPGTMRGGRWSLARDQFAVNIGGDDPNSAPDALVLGVAGGACRVIAPAVHSVTFASFSPDGAVFIWHELAASGDTVIHLTATDGSGERALTVPGNTYFSKLLPGAQRLLIVRSQSDGSGLSWIDLAEEPLRDHVLAQRISAPSWLWINDRWLLLGDSFSGQDDTFALRALDVRTGTSRLVSRTVADFAVGWSVRPADATSLAVAYVVRGRAPSTQDGLWLARLNLDEFPSWPSGP